MAGRRQKPYSQLQNKRGNRRRDMVTVDLGGGVTWEVLANSAAYASMQQPRVWREPEPSPKAAIARRKPRDERGRFVPATSSGDVGNLDALTGDADQLLADLAQTTGRDDAA